MNNPTPTPIGQLTPLDKRPPSPVVGPGDSGTDVLKQQLIDVSAPEGRIPTSGKRPTALHHGHIDRATPKIKHGKRPLGGPGKAGRVENGGRNGLRHEHDPRGEPVPGLSQHPGTNPTPVRGVGEDELVNSTPTNPLSLTDSPREHGPNDVPNLENVSPEQQLGFVNPPLGMRLIT
jgi:hypothetical protein